MTYFADKPTNKLAENRSALSTPDTSSVAQCSRQTTSTQCAHRARTCGRTSFRFSLQFPSEILSPQRNLQQSVNGQHFDRQPGLPQRHAYHQRFARAQIENFL